MIPEAAVDAAAKQMAVNDGGLIGWILYQADAKRVLEAAAPHMLAGVWDEGERTGRSRAMRHMSDEPNLPLVASNPYGSAE